MYKSLFSFNDRLQYGSNWKLKSETNHVVQFKWQPYENSSEVQLLTFSQLPKKELKYVYVVVFWKRPFIVVIKVNKQLKDKNIIVLQYLFPNCFQQIVRI